MGSRWRSVCGAALATEADSLWRSQSPHTSERKSMSVLRAWFHRFCNLFRKERLDREPDTELASHLEMHIEDKLRAGLTPEEARRVAFIKLGGLEQTKRVISP
jgi:hypothetical protein